MWVKLSIHARRVSDLQAPQMVTVNMSNSPKARDEWKQGSELWYNKKEQTRSWIAASELSANCGFVAVTFKGE